MLCIDTTLEQAAEWLDAGATDRDTVLEWLCTTKQSHRDVRRVFGAILDRDELDMVADAQEDLAAAREAAAARKLGGCNGKVAWTVSKRGAVSLTGVNVRFPVTMYVGQLRRVARDAFGLDDAGFLATPIGQWAASKPTRTLAVGDYGTKDDAEWLAVSHSHVTKKGAAVVVSLSESKDS